MRMNPEIKAKWIAALRSGKYEQCTGMLHKKGDGFCCLGVLCDLKGSTWEPPADPGAEMMVTDDGKSKDLPDSVMAWAGLIGTSPVVNISRIYETLDGGEYSCLAELNDNGMTFSEIADIIEEEL